MLKRLVLLVALGALALPMAAHAGSGVLEDLDARKGEVAPTEAQQDAAQALGADASWNAFGTPSSLLKDGDYLATGVAGGDAVAVARAFLDANAALFRLPAGGAASLELWNDAKLAGSEGHAVVFRQKFGDLLAAEGGMVIVGVVGDKVAYASSTLTGNTELAAQPTLTARQAWTKAAANVGRNVSVLALGKTQQRPDWTSFSVDGFAQVQAARLVAVPTPSNGVRPAWETLVVDAAGGAGTAAFNSFVDAVTGEVLVRKDIAEQSHLVGPQAFSGTHPGTDGLCVDAGTYAVHAGTVSIDVEGQFNLAANDIVLQLVFNGTVVAAADTLASPEVIHYEPAGGVPPGNYTVQVCEFPDGQNAVPPATYSGFIQVNEAAGTELPYPPKWKVFPANPPLGTLAQDPWNLPDPPPDPRKVWCWDSNINGNPVPGCDEEVGNLASRVPWDQDPATGFLTSTFTTRGNNAKSAESWSSPLTPGPTGFMPVSAQRNYDYPWTNVWETSDCFTPFVPGVSHDISAATTNLFAMHNRMHDWSYFLGFTEENWNAQDNNFGLTSPTRQNDSVLGDSQAGALSGGAPSYLGRDNANMIPLPDGRHPITNMYLWQPLAGAFYAPCVDGDYDMAVIGHEYGHLIENRMIGKGGTRSGHHAGAMGESNGDLNGMEILNEYNYVPVSGENPYSVGAYATGNKLRAIRNYGMNFPRVGAFPTSGVSPLIDPLNFSDIGYDITGSQVHADGEIWSATNFDIRQALIDKYNAAFPASNAALQRECAEGKRPAGQCPGNRRWIQLVYDAYLLMAVAPTMLQARDAYLQADVMRFGGANQNEIWRAFARRGFGQNAFSTNGLSDGNDNDPKADFASPIHGETAVTFRAVAADEGGAQIQNARIYVGHYEARVSPIADTNPATNATGGGANSLDATAPFVAGTYEFVANAPGYGHVRFRQTFSGGGSQTLTISMPTNRASTSKGATASGDGQDHGRLIDDTEGSNWECSAGSTACPASQAQGSQVTVNLQGTAPQRVTRVQVSAMLEPAENRFTALRQFRIDVSTNGTTFTPAFTSAPEAFPGVAPRPVAPEIILRSFTLPSARNATHVRIVVLNNQCTGQTAFQGEQDNDPSNFTDCRTGSPGQVGPLPGDLTPQVLTDRDDEVRIAELQVFSSGTGTSGGGGGGGGGGHHGGGGGDCDGGGDGDDHIAMSGPATAKPNATVTYTITYSNLGSKPDHGCRIDDLLGPGLTYVSSTNGGAFSAATRTVSWNLSGVAAGATRTMSVTAKATAPVGAVLLNQAWFHLLGAASPAASTATMVLP